MELLRFVRAADGRVLFDVKGGLPSRGAYTCASVGCISQAVERNGFRRAFDEAVIVTVESLTQSTLDVLETEVLRSLGLARRANQLVPGRDETWKRNALQELNAVVIARDLSERSQREVFSVVSEVPVLYGPPKTAMGEALGRGPTGVIGLVGGQVARRLIENLERLRRLLGLSAPPDAVLGSKAQDSVEESNRAPCETEAGSV
jgi:hypothetical protein